MDEYTPGCVVDSWDVFDSRAAFRKLSELDTIQMFYFDRYIANEVERQGPYRRILDIEESDLSDWWLYQRNYVNRISSPDIGIKAWKSILAGKAPKSWNVSTFRNIVANWSLKVGLLLGGSHVYAYRVYQGGYVYSEPYMRTTVFNPSLVDPCVFKRTYGMHLQPRQPVIYSGGGPDPFTYTFTQMNAMNVSPNLIGISNDPRSSKAPTISIGFYYGAGSFVPVAGPYTKDQMKFILNNISENLNTTSMDLSALQTPVVNTSGSASSAPLRYTAKMWYDPYTRQYYPDQNYMWDRNHPGEVEFMGNYYSLNQLRGFNIIERVDRQYMIVEFYDPR